jgi:hypothetical protein
MSLLVASIPVATEHDLQKLSDCGVYIGLRVYRFAGAISMQMKGEVESKVARSASG